MIGIKNASGEIMTSFMIRNINRIKIRIIEDKIQVNFSVTDIDVPIDRVVGIGFFSKLWWKIKKRQLRLN